MSNGWSAENYAVDTASVVASAVTDQVLTKAQGFPIYSGGAKHLVVKVVVSGVTVAGAITAKLQTAIGSDWQDSKTVSITQDGNFYIKLLAENEDDWAFLPLLNRGRVVITTTNAGDRVTVSSVWVLQEL